MSSFDKTMKFNFSDDSAETNVNEVLITVYDALQERATIQSTRLSDTCCQVIPLIFLGIVTLAI